MNKGELINWIPAAKQQFIEKFPQSEGVINDTEIVVLLRNNFEEKRLSVFEYCDVPFRVYEPSEGEAVIGSKKKVVIIYAWTIKSVKRFQYVLWHEWGHIYSHLVNQALVQKAEDDVKFDRDTPLRSGLSIWSEFIAETIAYAVEDDEPAKYPHAALQKLECYLDEAVNSGLLNVYPLAFFYAMAINNPTICLWVELNNGQVPLSNRCDDIVIPLVGDLLNILGRQTQKKNFVRISRAKLEEIGRHVDILWEYCETVGDVRYRMNHLIHQGR